MTVKPLVTITFDSDLAQLQCYLGLDYVAAIALVRSDHIPKDITKVYIAMQRRN